MLISRQVFYKTAINAVLDPDGDEYHDNCNCVAVPVFSRSEFQNAPIFEQNREFAKLWKEIYPKGGMDAWNRHFKDRKKKAKETSAAPEAAA